MSNSTSRQAVYKLIDELSDTKSWAELAKELNKYAAKTRVSEAPSGDTIEMDDLLKSLDSDDK